MAKIPAFQFYPADWRKDLSVQSLSYHDRGVWFEILCLMHESEQRGRLLLNGKPMPDEALARILGLDKQTLTKTLTCLLDLGVAARDEQGALVNRRMLRDEERRKQLSKFGQLGGNPALKKPQAKGKRQSAEPEAAEQAEPAAEAGEKPKVRRGSRIPEDFQVTEEMRAWAIRKCPAVDLETETLKFINYWSSKAGRDAVKLDWRRTWENWILRANEYKPIASKTDHKETATGKLQRHKDILEKYPSQGASNGNGVKVIEAEAVTA